MATNIPLDEIVDNPFQPRKDFDKEALKSLADEMKAEGFWTGALQGRRKNGKVELVFGHRRLRALRMLKTESVKVDILDLTDAQMALRSLEENLQREGLSDLEKADAVKRAVDITKESMQADGESASHAVTEVATRLGLGLSWVKELCQISAGLPAKMRPAVEHKYLAAQTAFAAKEWGGEQYLRTLAKQGKESLTDPKVAKPTQHTVKAMKRVVKEADEPVREKLKELIVTGEVVTPQEAEQKARRLASNHVKRQKEPPPDLKDFIVGWTARIKEWEQELKAVEPYMDYVEEAPAIAERFRNALKQFMETAKKLL